MTMITNLTDLMGMGGLMTGGPDMSATLALPAAGLVLAVVAGVLFVVARVYLDSRHQRSVTVSTRRNVVRVRPMHAAA
jgi:hypothetical protein